MLLAAGFLRAADPKPETLAAFDRYIKLTEEAMQARSTPENFLWLDQHQKEKTMVWMSQNFVTLQETLDHGQKIDVPDGSIQHWLGVVYLETATLDRVRGMLLDYANYKSFFKAQVSDSKLVKRDNDHFDATLRLRKKQITQVILNVDLSTDYKVLAPKRATLVSRSTRIGEVEHAGKKDSPDKELAPEDQNGYLWRFNMYWRLEQADVGVFAEIELISLSRAGGALHPGRYLTGFQSFPHELTSAFLDGLQVAFPAPRK